MRCSAMSAASSTRLLAARPQANLWGANAPYRQRTWTIELRSPPFRLRLCECLLEDLASLHDAECLPGERTPRGRITFVVQSRPLAVHRDVISNREEFLAKGKHEL